jgi:hypothetical protein
LFVEASLDLRHLRFKALSDRAQIFTSAAFDRLKASRTCGARATQRGVYANISEVDCPITLDELVAGGNGLDNNAGQ